jgi:hypothetical protein
MKLQEFIKVEKPTKSKKLKMIINEKQFNFIAKYIIDENSKISINKIIK